MDGGIHILRDHWLIPDDVQIKFLRKLRPELICSTCDAITPRGFKDEKSHVYCQECVKVFTDHTNKFTCQVCSWHGSRKYMETIEDEWKILEKMESTCPNEKSACHFSGPLKAVLEHYLSCKVSGKAPCSLCGKLLDIKLHPKHIQNECHKRILECIFCQTDVVACDKRAHETNCGMRPAECEHCKQPIDTYNKLKQEHYPICQQMPLSCEFEALGCPYRAPRSEMVKHISQSRHDSLFVEAIYDLRQENEGLRKFIREKLSTLERSYEEKIKRLESTVAQLEDKVSTESNLRETVAKSLDEVQHEIQALQTFQQTASDLVEERFSETELSIKRLDRELHLQPMMPGFEHVWKIQPYFALKDAAIASTGEISSGIVYVNKPGYALEFIAGFPRPSGVISTPQLSFKCRIHAGDFDDMLPWPFKEKLILVLFNQQDERGSKSFELDTQTADPTAECFKKPASESCRRMPVSPLLRGFAPHVPEDLQVTFCEDLPPDAVCVQCDNVSAVLHRDPGRHGYCTSCMNMCTNRYLFTCSVCGLNYRLSELQTDKSTERRIAKRKIICPKTTQRNPVYITFSALKVHLEDCSCAEAASDSEASGHASPVAMSPCSYCKVQVPKKLMMQHIKECKDKEKELRETRTEGAVVPEEPEKGAKSSYQSAPSQDLVDFVKESLSEIRGLRTEIAELKAVLFQNDEQIQQLTVRLHSTQNEVDSLKEALSQKQCENELLTETVQSHQIDMKNIQAQCDKNYDVIEQMTSDIQGMSMNLDEISATSSETKHRLHVVERGLENTNEHFSASINALKAENKQAVGEGMTLCLRQLHQLQAAHDALKTSHDRLLFHFFPPPQGHQQFHSSQWRPQ